MMIEDYAKWRNAAKTFVLWVLLLAALLVGTVYGLAAVAAFADSRYVCPDGNKCSDAIGTMATAAPVIYVSALLVILARRSLRVLEKGRKS